MIASFFETPSAIFPRNLSTLLQNEGSSSAKANDRVLIYFAGHGMTDDLPDGGEMGYHPPNI